LPKPREQITQKGKKAQQARESVIAPRQEVRSVSKLSHASEDSLRSAATGRSPNAPPALTAAEKPDFSYLAPPFLHERRMEVWQAARMLGYEGRTIERILHDGLPEGNLDVLVENLVHCSTPVHNGGLANYKVCIEELQRERQKEAAEKLSLQEDRLSLTSEALDGLQDTLESKRGSSRSRSLGGTKESNSSSSAGRSFTGRSHSHRGSKDAVSRSQRGTKDSLSPSQRGSLSPSQRGGLSPSQGGSKEIVGRSQRGTKDTVQGILKGTRENLRMATASKELQFLSVIDGEGCEETSPENLCEMPLPGEAVDTVGDGMICTICLAQPINVELLPCQHRVACENCMSKVGSLCPLCRTFVTQRRKL
jgi:hypothetical protein